MKRFGKEMKMKIAQGTFGDLALYIYEERYEGSHKILSLAKPVVLEMKQLDEGTLDYEPTIRIPREYQEDFIKNIQQEFDQKGFRLKKEAINEGELKATKYHLADLRRLLQIRGKK